jgi:hypothetical protein
MSRHLTAVAALVAASLIAATPRETVPPNLLDDAESALARGDYALAEQLFERAEPRAPDPGRVTIGLALAKYRLALETPSRAEVLLSEAESLYRSCLDPKDPRRGPALIGLGNCLLQKATNRDAGAAVSAADRFTEAARFGDPEVANVAGYNLQRARLLGRQIPTVPPQKSETPPAGDDSDRDATPPENSPGSQELTDRARGKRAAVSASQADDGQPATPTDEARAPGQGELPPVPDRDGQPQLSAAQAREHLEQAARRILQEGRQHRRANARPAASGVRDW